MKYFTVIISFLFIIMGWPATAAAQNTSADKRLAKIHHTIQSDYPNLSHVSAEEMTAVLSGGDNILLLDVRKEKEYAVSHIDGAVRVDPDISEDKFMQLYGDQAVGKNIVLYCSVGRRSSRLGDQVRARLLEKGAAKVSNLEGGIFGWHNASRPLMRGDADTDKVHPYNAWWGRLVSRKDGIAYKAESGSSETVSP